MIDSSTRVRFSASKRVCTNTPHILFSSSESSACLHRHTKLAILFNNNARECILVGLSSPPHQQNMRSRTNCVGDVIGKAAESHRVASCVCGMCVWRHRDAVLLCAWVCDASGSSRFARRAHTHHTYNNSQLTIECRQKRRCKQICVCLLRSAESERK